MDTGLVTVLVALIAMIGTAVTNIMMLLLKRDVKDVRVDIGEVHEKALTIEKHTNGMVKKLEDAALAKGNLQGKAEEKANPS